MAERFLHTNAEGATEGRTERTTSPAAIVFHQCESCRRTTCHALIHAGLLEVKGTPGDGLRWRPRSAGLEVSSSADARALGEVPVVRVASAIADTSAVPDMSDSAIDLADLAGALVNLGFPKTAALAKLERSRRELEARGAPLTEEEILRQALSA